MPEESSGRVQPFYISYESMSADELFQLADTSPDELRELYSQPFFFKAAETQRGELDSGASHGIHFALGMDSGQQLDFLWSGRWGCYHHRKP